MIHQTSRDLGARAARQAERLAYFPLWTFIEIVFHETIGCVLKGACHE